MNERKNLFINKALKQLFFMKEHKSQNTVIRRKFSQYDINYIFKLTLV